jgi:predicted DNA-binding transcriptional regulator AlpA
MNPPRCYTIKQVCQMLEMPRRTFFDLRKAGALPCLEELRPRLGRLVRYRADLIDRYVAGQWGQPRSFASHRRTA